MKSGPKPPRLCQWIFNRWIPWDEQINFFSAMDASFAHIHKTRGTGPASRWYWRQLFLSMPYFISLYLQEGDSMFRNHLKVALRYMQKNRSIAVINLTGLGVGLAAVLFILLFLRLELSFDRHHEKADRIVRMEKSNLSNEAEWSSSMPPALGPAMIADFPEVEASVRLIQRNTVHISANDKYFFEDGFLFCDPGLFDVFTIEFIQGEQRNALSSPNQVVLSESMVRKYFGEEDPIGRTVMYRGKTDLIVSGVIKDQPANASLTFHFLAPLDLYFQITPWLRPTAWNAFTLKNYFLLRSQTEISSVESRLPDFLKNYLDEDRASQVLLRLQPLTQIHFETQRKNIVLFGGIAFLVLITAILNYINLATARASTRVKEIGLRKVVGARRKTLIGQFVTESILMTVAAFTLGLLLLALFMPVFNRLLGTLLDPALLMDPVLLSWLLGLILAVGVLAGLYPAMLISACRPADIFRTKVTGRSRAHLRSALVIFQFVTTLVLVALMLITSRQMQYVNHRDLGFQRENILIVDARDDRLQSNKVAIRQLLKQNPAISHASFSASPANFADYSTLLNWPGREEGQDIEVYLNFVDEEFTDVFGLALAEGRNLSGTTRSQERSAFLINETLARTIGWENAVGRELEYMVNNRKGIVVGVLKDFHMLSLHEAMQPLIFDYRPELAESSLSISLTREASPQLITEIQNVVRQFAPDYPFVLEYFEEVIRETYAPEFRMQRLFSLFSFLAVCIAGMGLYGLTAFTVQRQIREIGIRKALGASVASVVYRLSRQLGRNILIANVLAWPLIAWLSGKWLERFVYHTRIDWRLFAGATLIALAVGLLTVSVQAYRAARVNPSESLRYE